MANKKRAGDHFPFVLREIRGHFGPWTQKEFAKRLGVAESTLIRWEKGSSLPTTEALLKILEIDSEISVEWLFTGGGPELERLERKNLALKSLNEELQKPLPHGMQAVTEYSQNLLEVALEYASNDVKLEIFSKTIRVAQRVLGAQMGVVLNSRDETEKWRKLAEERK